MQRRYLIESIHRIYISETVYIICTVLPKEMHIVCCPPPSSRRTHKKYMQDRNDNTHKDKLYFSYECINAKHVFSCRSLEIWSGLHLGLLEASLESTPWLTSFEIEKFLSLFGIYVCHCITNHSETAGDSKGFRLGEIIRHLWNCFDFGNCFDFVKLFRLCAKLWFHFFWI